MHELSECARVRVYVRTPCRVVLTRHAGERCPSCARAANDDEICRCAQIYIVVVDGERRGKDGKLCFTFSFIFKIKKKKCESSSCFDFITLMTFLTCVRKNKTSTNIEISISELNIELHLKLKNKV